MNILQLLISFLRFFGSPIGMMSFLIGVLIFFILPIIPKLAGDFYRLARFHLWLAAGMLGRCAIVVSEHGDLLLKQMSFDDKGVEVMKFDGVKKQFEDPDNAVHNWMGVKFALADELHGVLFDPRHAALGMRRREYREKGELSFRSTDDEWEEFGVEQWRPGVFQMPEKHELVDPAAVREIVDGGERAEHPEATDEIYRKSRLPFMSGASTMRLILLIVALLAPFAMMWLLATQTSGAAGGGGGPTIVGSLALAPLAALLSDTDWIQVAKGLLIASVLPLIFGALFVLVSPLFAILVFVVMGMGFWLVPIITFVYRLSPVGGGGLARLLFRLGFLPYDYPVFKWTRKGYRVHEFENLEHEDADALNWYSLHGAIVGFTYPPSEDAWGPEVLDEDRIEARRGLKTDGGEDIVRTNLPAEYDRAPSWRRSDVYAAYLPKTLKRSYYYLDSGISRRRFADSAVGEKSLHQLTESKKEHGENDGLSDRKLMWGVIGLGLLSFMMGAWVFFL